MIRRLPWSSVCPRRTGWRWRSTSTAVDAPRAVVLLPHGGGQSRHAWDVTAQRLHHRDYTVLAYDARGHGDSDWDPDGRYDGDRLGSDLLAVRSYADSGSPVAAMGGLTILGTPCSLRRTYGRPSCWLTSLREWRWTAPDES